MFIGTYKTPFPAAGDHSPDLRPRPVLAALRRLKRREQHGSHISAKKKIWGWYFFDWAASPTTRFLTFIFRAPISPNATAFWSRWYGVEAAKAQAQAYWGYGPERLGGHLYASWQPDARGGCGFQRQATCRGLWLFFHCNVVGSGRALVDGTARILGCFGRCSFSAIA